MNGAGHPGSFHAQHAFCAGERLPRHELPLPFLHAACACCIPLGSLTDHGICPRLAQAGQLKDLQWKAQGGVAGRAVVGAGLHTGPGYAGQAGKGGRQALPWASSGPAQATGAALGGATADPGVPGLMPGIPFMAWCRGHTRYPLPPSRLAHAPQNHSLIPAHPPPPFPSSLPCTAW